MIFVTFSLLTENINTNSSLVITGVWSYKTMLQAGGIHKQLDDANSYNNSQSIDEYREAGLDAKIKR